MVGQLMDEGGLFSVPRGRLGEPVVLAVETSSAPNPSPSWDGVDRYCRAVKEKS
jgi:hypothetical protein